MKKEIIIKILDTLDKEGKLVKKDDLKLELEQYGEILEIMQDGNLISDVKITHGGGKILAINTDRARITITGIEYLEQSKKEYDLVNSINSLCNNIQLLNTTLKIK